MDRSPDANDIIRLPLVALTRPIVPGERHTWRASYRREFDVMAEATRRNGVYALCMCERDDTDPTGWMPVDFGTEGLVEAFDPTENGKLDVVLRGRRRFRIVGKHMQADPVPMVDVQWLDPVEIPVVSIDPPGYGLMYRAIVKYKMEEEPGLAEAYPDWASPECIDNAEWVGWRASTSMGCITPERLLHLLSMDDANERLNLFTDWILDFPIQEKPAFRSV